MGRRSFLPAVCAGCVLWAGVAVACSATRDDRPAAAPWRGTLAARAEPRLQGAPLAIAWDASNDSETLYRIDPRTLRLRHGLPLGRQALRQWDLSPDGERLLLSTFRGHVRVVDLREMRDAQRFSIDQRWVVDVAWVDDDVAILVSAWRDRTKLIRFRPSTGDVLDERTLDTHAFTLEQAAGGIALLGYEVHDYEDEWQEPGPVTFAVMDAAGEVGVRRIPEIGAGYFGPRDDSRRVDPGLALDDDAAAIVGVDGTVATVDLDDLAVTVLERDDSLLDALAAWFVPEAHAKMLDWTTVEAEYVDDDTLLVSGRREHLASRDEGPTPGGAALVDLDEGEARMLEPAANAARVADDLLLVWRRALGDDRGEGIGLVAYDRGGRRVWHVMKRGYMDVLAVHDGVAYLQHGWDRVFLTSVDLGTGEVLRKKASTANVLAL